MGKRVLEYIEIDKDGQGRKVYKCTKCGAVLGPVTKSLKECAVVEEIPYSRCVDMGILSMQSDRFVLRAFYCPKCAVQFDVESVLRGEPYLDIKIDDE
jgi:acetone carboxylase gamma subunit